MVVDYILYFFIYGFIGWVAEEIYHAVRKNQLVNRGFLNGPICPIYGYGMILITLILDPIKKNVLLLFLGSVIVCSALEFVTGFVLKVAFHKRWWDYSRNKFNIGGYICLGASVAWGVAGVIAIDLVQPAVDDLVDLLPHKVALILAWVFCLIMIADTAATAVGMAGLNKRLRPIEEMGEKIRVISDELTDAIYDSSMDAVGKYQQHKSDIEAKKAELEDLKKRMEEKKEEVAHSLTAIQRRTLRAFPHMESVHHAEIFRDIKDKAEMHMKKHKKA